MRALSPKTLNELRTFVSGTVTLDQNLVKARLLEAIDRALTPKRSVAPAKKLRAKKKATRRDETKDVREAVANRAAGRCEHCGALFGPTTQSELDHARGGANRRESNTFEGTWMLCRFCHLDKTRNCPHAAFWLRAFIRHTKKHGYANEQRLAEARLESLEMQGRG